MKKHASSHGLAVLVCTISAGFIVKICEEYYPKAVQLINKFSDYFVRLFDLKYSVNTISVLAIAFILACIWGCAFSFMHAD